MDLIKYDSMGSLGLKGCKYLNKSRCFYLFLAQIFILVISLCINATLPNNDTIFAWFFVIFFILSFLLVWYSVGKNLTPYNLFLITIALFLGGRYFGYLLGSEMDIFRIQFFVNYEANLIQKREITLFLILFIGLMNLGYVTNYFLCKKRIPITNNFLNNNGIYENRRIANLVKRCFYPFSIVIIISSINKLIEISQKGYLALYMSQTEEYSTGIFGIISVLFMVFFGLSFGFCNRQTQKRYLILYVFRSFVTILMGARGAFGTTLLFLVWIYSQTNKISLKKILLLCLVAFIILMFIFSFSFRANDSSLTSQEENNPLKFLTLFISGQGISLMVFDASRLINDYPGLAYFQSIIPGSSFFYSLITGKSVLPIDNNFSNYLCFSLDKNLYNSGIGLGWNLMSDFYFFGFQNIVGFSIISFLFGNLLGKITINAFFNKWSKSLLFTISIPLMFLPRGSLNSFATVIVYSCVSYFILNRWSNWNLYKQVKFKESK